MFKDERFKAHSEHRQAAVGAVLMLAVSTAIWLHRGSLTWMDTIVATVGAAMLVAAASELRRAYD